MSEAVAKVLLDYASNYIKVPRPAIETLCSDPLTLTVFTMCISRARWTAGGVLRGGHGVVQLSPGQAVFGRDELAELCGSTPRRIRTAFSALRSLGYVTTESTSRGTIVTVLGYAGNVDGAEDKRPTDRPTIDQQIDQQATNGRPLTKKKEAKKGRREKKEPRALPEEAIRLSGLLFTRLASANSTNTFSKLQAEPREKKIRTWAGDLDLLNRIDGAPWTDIEAQIEWATSHRFWGGVIQSGSGLRDNYNKIAAQRAAPTNGANKPITVGRYEPCDSDWKDS
ncbi:MAG: hypothetical protein AB7O24_28575 [Kofleriaceae bacterium]